MTTSEFKEEFKLLYDNISSNAAPGLDAYEMSVYLTTAQLELVKKAYSGSEGVKSTQSITRGKPGFEGNERRRRELSSLVQQAIIAPTTTTTGLKSYSMLAEIPDVLYIIHERARITSTDTCIDNSIVEVIPVTHDEYFLVEENPFRKESKRRALRLDHSDKNSVELICPYVISQYIIRYLSIPSPIILTDLETDPEFDGLGLSINGETTESTCLLNEGIHREILNRAVALAIRDYRENTLSNKIQSELGLDYKED